MGAKTQIPLVIAIKGVELAHSQVFPLNTPSEAPILEVYLVKLTRLESSPKAVDMATIDICIVLVTSPTDLVEIAKYQPFDPIRGL
jgi:hypothetical protein